MARHIGALLPLIAVSLGLGALGYYYIEDMPWADALFNASTMISGMGPVSEHATSAGKIFSSLYALYCSLFLVAMLSYLIAPILHRLLHKFHKAD